jgi:ubiquinone/menaquinone biosynthesis C-methylase UbiE
VKVREHFDEKADSYYEHVYLSGKKNHHVHNQQVRREYFRGLIYEHQARQNGLGLDIGAGPGSITIVLAQGGFDTYAVDLSFRMLRNNRKYAGNDAKLAQCSAESLSYKNGAFDIVTAAGVLEYVDDDNKALGEILRVLKPGGTLIISVPIKESALSAHARKFLVRLLFKKDIAPFHHKHYTPERFREKVEKAGYRLETSTSHHFVFFPLDYLVPNLSVRFDYILTRLFAKSSALGRFGKTYIVSARKPS